jgi:AGZA family xanthine/uracil permease-like MFS transporter
MKAQLDRWFEISARGSTVRRELWAGLTTFMTMAYIIVVQPAVLSGRMFGQPTGMDFGAVMAATCLASALATALMALYGRYPIAQAPGMGQNVFFVFSVLPVAAAAGLGEPWRVALGAVFWSGILFLVLSLAGLRELIFNALSPSLKHGLTAGIGLFIAFIGLQNAGLIEKDPGTAVRLTHRLLSPDVVVFVTGFWLTAVLTARAVPGAVLWGMATAAAVAWGMYMLLPHLPAAWREAPAVAESLLSTRFQPPTALVAPPPSLAPTFLQLDWRAALSPAMVPLIAVLLFMFVFDAIGTLIAVCEQAGLMQGDRLPRARQAMISDAVGTVVGSLLGTSTVTSYVESAAGVAQGGRTGLVGLVVAALFLAALVFEPLVATIGNYPPITAPALVYVGVLMLRQVTRIAWDDPTESIPAFLIVVGIPLSFSIADGLALGLVTHPILKLLSRRGREVGVTGYVLAVLLLLYLALLRSRLG